METDELDIGEQAEPTGPGRMGVFVAIVVVTLVICGVLVGTGTVDATTIQSTVQSTGLEGMLIFIGLATALELLWLPRAWTIVAAAALFGLLPGVVMSLVSDTLSAIICYWLARTTGRQWVERLVSRRPRAKRVLRLLMQGRRGGATIGVLRMMPVAHYTLTSYAAGLAAVPWRAYLVGSTLGLIPGAFVYAMAGASIMDPGSPMFIFTAGLLTVAFIASAVLGKVVIARAAASEEDEASGSAGPPLAAAAQRRSPPLRGGEHQK